MREIGIIALLVALGACSSGEDAVPTPTTEAVEPVVEVVAVPDLQAAGCPPVDPAATDAIQSGLADGLTLAVATSQVADDITWVVGSIYRDADGERVSSADTWIVRGIEVLSLSGSANEYSSFPDARDQGFGFDDPTRSELESCAIAALRG